MNTDPLGPIIGGIVGVIVAWFTFKTNSQNATNTFQDNLIKRIESLEEDNEELRDKNEELLIANNKERKKQLELEAKISAMENEKLQMLDRIQQLEDVVSKLTNQMKKMEGLNGNAS